MENSKIFKTASISLAFLLMLNFQFIACSEINQQRQERKLPAFSVLNLSISADVYVKQGSVQKVEIQASDKYLELIETEVKGNGLTIKWKERNVNTTEKITIYITMTEVNGLKISGSGDIYAQGKISTTNVELAISGSGNINVEDLKAEKINSSISGSADINVNGTYTASELIASISGSGNIKAQDLPVKNVEISISGSGDCKVNAVENLKARIAGSGDVYYKGRAVIDGKVSGSGSIKHVD